MFLIKKDEPLCSQGGLCFLLFFIEMPCFLLTYLSMLWLFQRSDVKEYTNPEKYYYTTRSLYAR